MALCGKDSLTRGRANVLTHALSPATLKAINPVAFKTAGLLHRVFIKRESTGYASQNALSVSERDVSKIRPIGIALFALAIRGEIAFKCIRANRVRALKHY